MVNATASIYDLTNSSNSENLFEFIVAVNDLTGQWFMLLILLSTFIIFFFAFKNFENRDALLGAGFITTIMTFFFTTLNLINTTYSIFIFAVFGIFFTYRMIKG